MSANPTDGLDMGSFAPEPKIGSPDFPTTPGLPSDHYPDVTPQFNDVKDDMYGKIFNAQHPQVGSPKSVNSLLQDNFQPQGCWDLTSKPGFPGKSDEGQTEYGQFKGGTVTGEFLNNHLFGLGMAASGQYPQDGLSDSDPTYGTPYPQAQLPQGINHPEAIASGYKSYHGDDSWQQQPITSLADNSTPAPVPDSNGPVLSAGIQYFPPTDPQEQPAPSTPPDSAPDESMPQDPESQQTVVWSTDDDDDNQDDDDSTSVYDPTTDDNTSPDPVYTPSDSSNPPSADPMQDFLQKHSLAQVQMSNPVIQPPNYSLAPHQTVHPMISAYPSARTDYGGVPVHPVHAQEMAQVDQAYIQNGHPPLNPVEISQWPKTQRFHQARAQQIQQQAQANSWHPSQSQIQRRDFQMSSRGGFDNHPLQSPLPTLQQVPQALEHTFENAYTQQVQKLPQLFGNSVFPQALSPDMQHTNVQRLAYIANWILKGRNSNRLDDINVSSTTPEQRRLLNIAAPLNQLLLQNELQGNHRDDALTFAKSLQVLVNANTYPNGSVDEARFIHDLKYFAIDQGTQNSLSKGIQMLSQYRDSNAAYNLLSGPRLGAVGWNPKYWDNGHLYEKNAQGQPVLINQAHHFAAFFIAGLENDPLAEAKSIGLDLVPYNSGDLSLSDIAIQLGQSIRNKTTSWNQLPLYVYTLIRN